MEPITDRHFTDVALQGVTKEYRDVNLMTWKDQHLDLPKIQSVLRHLPGRSVEEQNGKDCWT